MISGTQWIFCHSGMASLNLFTCTQSFCLSSNLFSRFLSYRYLLYWHAALQHSNLRWYALGFRWTWQRDCLRCGVVLPSASPGWPSPRVSCTTHVVNTKRGPPSRNVLSSRTRWIIRSMEYFRHADQFLQAAVDYARSAFVHSMEYTCPTSIASSKGCRQVIEASCIRAKDDARADRTRAIPRLWLIGCSPTPSGLETSCQMSRKFIFQTTDGRTCTRRRSVNWI